MESGKILTSSADSASKTLTRRSETRREKRGCLENRKLHYYNVKKVNIDEKKHLTVERRASDRFHFTARSMSANASSASV